MTNVEQLRLSNKKLKKAIKKLEKLGIYIEKQEINTDYKHSVVTLTLVLDVE